MDKNTETISAGAATKGSAAIQSKLWGPGAQDWADYFEPVFAPAYDAVFAEAGLKSGMMYLDVGCGAGQACQVAFKRGAKVHGMDATPELIAIAQSRTPQGEFVIGDMEALSYPNGKFDLVSGFNSFQFAASPKNALTEAHRVAKPGAKLSIFAWGKPENAEAAPTYFAAIKKLLPPPPGAPGPFALSADGALEEMVKLGGWKPGPTKDFSNVWVFASLEIAVRAWMSVGPSTKAIEVHGAEKVKEELTQALSVLKKPSGEVHMRNAFRYVIASK